MESIIRAPVAGTVLELLVNEGDPVVPLTSYQAGTAAHHARRHVARSSSRAPWTRSTWASCKEGMPARIKVGAMPDAAVEGTVYKIAPKSKTAEGATLFDVEIALKPGAERRPARRLLRQRRHRGAREDRTCCCIPERLVTFADGKATVEVPPAGEGEPVKKEIKVGLSDGINIEVAEGLAAEGRRSSSVRPRRSSRSRAPTT